MKAASPLGRRQKKQDKTRKFKRVRKKKRKRRRAKKKNSTRNCPVMIPGKEDSPACLSEVIPWTTARRMKSSLR